MIGTSATTGTTEARIDRTVPAATRQPLIGTARIAARRTIAGMQATAGQAVIRPPTFGVTVARVDGTTVTGATEAGIDGRVDLADGNDHVQFGHGLSSFLSGFYIRPRSK
jgi:hypothetical protein